jgi:hypothetical protein
VTSPCKIVDIPGVRNYYLVQEKRGILANMKKLRCEKYNQDVDIELKPCPHPLDHCVYRSRCVINRMCMEDPKCREKRRASNADTR